MNQQTAGQTLRSWLTEAPFSLCLSSGFFGFFAHAGVVSVLEDEGLLPESLSGSSAGALIAGLWASGVSASEMKDALISLRRTSFWDPGIGLGLLKGELFDQQLDELLRCQLFEETETPVKVTAFNLFKLRGVVFDHGSLRDAIRASCTYPGLFQPKWIDGVPYLDGGITDRAGRLGLRPGQRVLYHHLLSRSKWRNALGLTKPPTQDGQVTLCLGSLPRCGPSRLEFGVQAYQIARELMHKALDLPIREEREGMSAQLVY